MAQKVVLSDASPLIGLAAAGGFELLHKLFRRVTITAAVRREVAAGKELPGAKELAAAIDAKWIRVIKGPPVDDEFAELGDGEASTLSAALKIGRDCLVLMDEPLGRAHAKARGIAVTGMAGVLLAAKRAGLVKAVQPFFETLAATDFRISDEVVRTILEDAGET